MARILISFLGTGRATKEDGTSIREYRKAKYSIDGKVVGESSFVSSVLMDHFQFDHLILIGTCKSMWEAVYEYYCDKNGKQFKMDTYVDLADSIEGANHQTNPDEFDVSGVISVLGDGSDAIVIPYGLNRKEQMIIFSRIGNAFEQFRKGDEIILDVTHSFRSLPLFTTSIINYFQSLSNNHIVFSKIYYGMLDAMSELNYVAPIIDISTAVELQNWTTAAYSFKEYGKGAMLADLLGGDEGKIIKIFSDAVNINYLNEIKSKLTNFQQLAENEFDSEFAQWVVPDVLKSFTERLQRVGNSHWRFQFELSRWHREKQNYSSAYIVFVEGIITFVCEQEGWDWKQSDIRQEAKKALTSRNAYELRKVYTNANKSRNNIAHNLDRRSNQTGNDISNLGVLQKEFLKLVKQKR